MIELLYDYHLMIFDVSESFQSLNVEFSEGAKRGLGVPMHAAHPSEAFGKSVL